MFRRSIKRLLRPYSNKRQHLYNAVVCAIFRNEGEFLGEWLEFHIALGFEHFYLYNNASTDDYMSVLAPYIHKKTVTLLHTTKIPPKLLPTYKTIQDISYEHYLKNFGKSTTWCAYIDIDEFIFPRGYTHLADILSKLEKSHVGGIYIRWQIFGTSNVSKVPKGKLLESMQMKADLADPLNLYGKAIVRTKFQIGTSNAHCPLLKPGYHLVEKESIQINHYFCRDQNFFYKTRVVSRRNAAVFDGKHSNQEVEHRFNKVHDRSILGLLTKLRNPHSIQNREFLQQGARSCHE